MPNRPTHDSVLSRYAKLLGPTPKQFILDKVFPAVDVPGYRGNYLTVNNGFAAASPGNRVIRVDGMERPDVIAFSIDETTGWLVEENGVGTQIDDKTRKYYEALGLDVRLAAIEILWRYNAILRERLGSALAFSATTFSGYTTTLAGADQWSDDASNPIANSKTARTSVRRNGGVLPNTLIVGAVVDDSLSRHPMIVEYASRTLNSVGLLSDSQIAQAMGVENYVVGLAAANSAVPGATESNADLWGKYGLFAYLEPSPSPLSPQSCLQRWRLEGSEDGTVNAYDLPGGYVEQLDMLWTDQLAVPTPALGYLFVDAVA
jgi:hypothetical protein